MNVIIAENYDLLSKKAATIIATEMNEKPDGIFGFATGSSPVGTYKELIKMYEERIIDFSKITSFNLDEYIGLNKEHDQSYYYFMHENLFNHVNMREEYCNIPNGMADDMEAFCNEYENEMQKAGGIDLQILGIGPNGHIAFNEPTVYFPDKTHTVKLTDSTIEANARFFENKDMVPKEAVTMGIGSIMRAKKIVMVVNGKGKAEAVRRMLKEDVNPNVPASILRYHPNVTVILDKEAASLL